MAAVFGVAVLVPTLVLAWLAVRSLRDQELVVNSQRAILHKVASDALAADLNTFMEDVRVFYGRLVDDLIKEQGLENLSENFDEIVPKSWGQARFGCVVTDEGKFLSPDISSRDPDTVEFINNNRLFLTNKARAMVYQSQGILTDQIQVSENQLEEEELSSSMGRRRKNSLSKADGITVTSQTSLAEVGESQAKQQDVTVQKKVEVVEEKLRSIPYRSKQKTSSQQARQSKIAPKKEASDKVAGSQTPPVVTAAPMKPIARNVVPSVEASNGLNYRIGNEQLFQRQKDAIEPFPIMGNWSSLEVNSGNLRELMKDRQEGTISRFLQDGLHILIWNRHPAAPGRVFWAELNLDEIRSDLSRIVGGAKKTSSENSEVCLALLDSDGDVVAQTVPGFKTDWKHPFVASEVGEILPHWEVAAYFLDPDLIGRSAKTARFTIWLIVPILLMAITVGAILIFRSVEFEMRFARKKTDFVSNVSHELKTPLTSIRMFSDLLAGNSNPGTEKTKEYSGIVSKEAAKLSRLINNLLDFSRMDRGDMPFKEEAVDLVSLTRETVDAYRMQLESEGCELVYKEEITDAVFLQGDRDALSRVLLNLLSNAEKYGCCGGEIEVRLFQQDQNEICWEVLDRGPGIERKHAAKIFDKFYRADESLSTGIQGTGLGLSIASQIVHHHKGSLTHRNRSGGGSVFTVSFPINSGES